MHRSHWSVWRWPGAALCLALLIIGVSSPAALAATWPGAGEAEVSRPTPQTDAEPNLGEFLDAEGHLQLPPGFSGSVNPAGYQIISGEGEALRFAPEVATSNSGDGWTGFGGIGNGCNGRVLAVAVGSAGEIYFGGNFTLCGDVPANNVARFDTATQTWSILGDSAANGVNNTVSALAISGSTLYMGGGFTAAGGATANRVARFETTTQTWSALGSGAANGVNSSVIALAVSGSSVYVGGAFTEAGGATANRVARFETTTQTWSALGSGAANGVNNSVLALAISGSTLYMGGVFTAAGGATANRVARFETTTQTWSALGSGSANGVNSSVIALAVSGSSVYVGGAFTEAGGATANRVARFDTTTQTWSALGSGAANGVNGGVSALAVSGSAVYAGGNFTEAGGAPANRVARFDTTTQTWAPLGSGATNGVSGGGSFPNVGALAVSGSTVYVGGNFTQAGGALANNVARFDTSSQTWAPLGSGVANGVAPTVSGLAVSGSTVYLSGFFFQAGGAPANRVARFDTSTQTWAPLGSGPGNGLNDLVSALAVSGSTLYVGGDFTQAGGVPANRVARFDTSTQTWAPLGSGATNGVNGGVSALAVSGSAVYAGGNFTEAGGAPANRVARFDTTTQTWSALGSGAANGVNNTVNALAVSGNTVYAGGNFTEAGGAPANRVARFDTTTQTWAPLGSGATNGVNGGVVDLAVSGSTVYVGGAFTEAGGATANRVARFDTTTQTWSALGSGVANGVNNTVFALAVSGSTVYVGGAFTEAGGATANRVARFDTTTQTWATLGSGVANGVNNVIALSVSGSSVYVGGLFTEAGGATANRVARFETTTQTWSALGSGSANGVNSSVIALAVSGSTVFVGGNFGSAGGQVSSNIASYRQPLPLTLSVVPATVLVGNSSAISVSGGVGSGAVSVQLTSGGAFCSLVGATLTALAQGECLVTATKASDGVNPVQTDSVLVRTVTEPGVNLVVQFSELPPSNGLPAPAERGACTQSGFRVSVLNNGPLDAAAVRLQVPSPSGLLPPVNWICALAQGQCTPQSGQGAVDTTFALAIGARAEIDLFACPDPNAAFANFQFRATLPTGTLLFPAEAQGNVSAPLNNIGIFRDGFE